jgi:hypothetical protein
MFMTASTWGTWHQELHINEAFEFPIALPTKELKDSLIKIVQRLKQLNLPQNEALTQGGFLAAEIQTLEYDLDELIFDMYKLTAFERSLIRERCTFDIDLYYNGMDSRAVKPIVQPKDYESYIKYFQNQWSRYLNDNEYFQPTIVQVGDLTWTAILFSLRTAGEDDLNKNSNEIITRYDLDLQNNINKIVHETKQLTYETTIRSISEHEIIIIKKNQRKNWTVVEAQSDFDATLIKAMNKIAVIQ